MITAPFIEVRRKRAKDVTDQDVIRICPSQPWREVLNVFHGEDEVFAVFRPDGPHEPDFAPHMANLQTGEYTAFRLLIQEESTAGEIADAWFSAYNYDLVEIQYELREGSE